MQKAAILKFISLCQAQPSFILEKFGSSLHILEVSQGPRKGSYIIFTFRTENSHSSFIFGWKLISRHTRKCPLRKYILGVLTHTTAWDQFWRDDETLKWVSIYITWLHLAYCNEQSTASPCLMDLRGLRGTQTTHFSLLTHAKQLLSVTFCD